MKPAKSLTVSAVLAILLAGADATLQASDGIVTGGKIYELPAWFKTSFLDFNEDVDEARVEGRHVVAFFHMDECPYCSRMIEESFIEGENRDFMADNFDVIGLNVLGDLEIAWIDGNSYSEKALAEQLGAIATPTSIFLDLEGQKVLQLNGYRDPDTFRTALDYVQDQQYDNLDFSDYLASTERDRIYEFRDHDAIAQATYLKDVKQPLMVLFEDRYCELCNRFHDKTLNHPDVLAAMEGYLVVRLDTESDTRIVTPDGAVTTASHWVRDLGFLYRPSFVLFDGGTELYRSDGILYHHHMVEALLWTKSGHRQYADIEVFKEDYRAELLESGRNVDFSE